MRSTSRQNHKSSKARKLSPIQVAYRPVMGALEEVERRLRSPEAIEGLAEFLGLSRTEQARQEAQGYIIDAGGKRLRAAITLLSAKLCGVDENQAVPLAVGIELFHTASLVIDDMIVDSRTRRSKLTVHRIWDESGALSAAIGLQLRSVPAFIESLKGAGDPVALLSLVGQTITRVLWGAILQHRQRMNFELTEEEYMEMIGHKTGALFEACSEGGALLAGSPIEEKEAMLAYGQHLGKAFQLTDDLLDFVGDQTMLGKSPGSDLKEGRLTLPMIHFLRKASEKKKTKMAAMIPPRRKSPLPSDKIAGLLDAEGSLEYCDSMAKAESEKARKSLSEFPASAEKKSLLFLASMASERQG